MTTEYAPNHREALLICRAAAHACPDDLLNPEARFAPGVTQDRVAALMYALEDGAHLTRGRHGRWYAPTGHRLAGMTNLSQVVNEAIRTGLVTHMRTVEHASNRRDVLVPAKTHLAQWDEGLGMNVSVCDATGENMGPKRVRLVNDPVLVDCLACL
jgi:hypothetical protein